MSEVPMVSNGHRNLLVRGLFMLLMLVVFHVCGTVLGIATVIQFVLTLISGTPNERLIVLGRNLGCYLRQIVDFLTFVTEIVPFPFSDWPSEAGE